MLKKLFLERFIFVDNPDVESVEPRIAERRKASRDSIYQLFCTWAVIFRSLWWSGQHPREAVPPFTQAMMKQAPAASHGPSA